MDPQTSSHLISMPQELTERIADFLPTVDLSSLRLSCKALEHRLLNYFSRKFFTKKQFMMTETSLQALIEISEHPCLSPCLKHLIVGLDQYVTCSRSGSAMLDVRPGDTTQHKLATDAQKRLFTTGRAVSLLSKALSNLKNLESVNVRDFNSRTRFRDAESGSPEWRSYGHATAVAQGHRLRMATYDFGPEQHYSNCVFEALLAAIAGSSSRPQAIIAIIRTRGQGLRDSALAIDHWLEPGIAPALQRLETLHLDLCFEEILHSTDQDLIDPSNTQIRRFLSYTTSLSWLRMNFKNAPKPEVYKFINWLAMVPGQSPVLEAIPSPSFETGLAPASWTPPPWSDMNPAPVALPLSQLELGFAHVTIRLLRNIFRKFTGLKSVTLFALTAYPTGRQASNNRVNLWAELLRGMMAARPPNLKTLKIHDLKQAEILGANMVSLVQVIFDGMQRRDVLVSSEVLEHLTVTTTVCWTEATERGSNEDLSEYMDYSDEMEDVEDEDDDE